MRVSKKKVTNLDELEEYYSRNRKFKFSNNYKPNNFKELYIKFLGDHNNNDTYFPNSNKLHCENNRNRSVDDLITITKYYFPDMTVKQILKEIDNNLSTQIRFDTSYNKYIYISYCGNIRKNNFWYNSQPMSGNNGFTSIQLRDNGFSNLDLTINQII